MENVILTPKEFLFLCAEVGVSEVYGIVDGYKDVNFDDPSAEIRLVRQSLECKGYIESDFDGNSSVRSDVIECVNVCANCQKLITLDIQFKSGDKKNIVYYFYEDKTVRSLREADGYKLSYVSVEDAQAEIKQSIKPEAVEAPKLFDKVHIPQREVEKQKKLALSGKMNDAAEAMGKYFEAEVSAVLLNSFKKKENFYSLVTVDFTAEEDNVKNLMFINSSIGNIRMKPIVVDLRTEIEFEQIDEQTIIEIIDNNLRLVTSSKTGDEDNG